MQILFYTSWSLCQVSFEMYLCPTHYVSNPVTFFPECDAFSRFPLKYAIKKEHIHLCDCNDKCKNLILPALCVPSLFKTEALICSSIVSPSVVRIDISFEMIMVCHNFLAIKHRILDRIILNLYPDRFSLILSIDAGTIGIHEHGIM